MAFFVTRPENERSSCLPRNIFVIPQLVRETTIAIKFLFDFDEDFRLGNGVTPEIAFRTPGAGEMLLNFVLSTTYGLQYSMVSIKAPRIAVELTSPKRTFGPNLRGEP